VVSDKALTAGMQEQLAPLYRLSLSILHSQADAQDAVQQGMLRAWEKRRQVSEEYKIRAWLARIVVNECRNIQRKNRWETVNNQEERIAYPQDADRTMHDLILSLPDKLRLPVVLVFMEGMTGAQAAKALAIPQGTVHSRIHKARQILKTKWEEANRE